MAGRRYLILDVFAGQALQGNPLAVVLDADGLDTARMQAITREFNLSETVFVLPPLHPRHAARIRIFAPEYEMPFAGHPTVGTAIALAAEHGVGDGELLVLEENIGPVRCVVRRGQGASFAEFDAPQIAAPLPAAIDDAAAAEALGLDGRDIGFGGHRIGAWSAGVPYVTIPVRNLDAMRRIRFDPYRWQAIAPDRPGAQKASAYVYCRETELDGSSFHMRMFVGALPSYEDPATGSAAAAFVGAFVASERPAAGAHELWIEQGVEMGRPSRIRLVIDVERGKAVAARIGGEAVIVARGEIHV